MKNLFMTNLVTYNLFCFHNQEILKFAFVCLSLLETSMAKKHENIINIRDVEERVVTKEQTSVDYYEDEQCE